MKPAKIFFIAICIVLAAATAYAKAPQCKSKKPKSTCKATSIDGCPNEGCGGDAKLNVRKNITTPPASADVQHFTRGDFVKLKFPAKWAAGTVRTLLKTWGEGTPVEYEAYLVTVKHYQCGMESCNCNLKKDENNDFHLVTFHKKNIAEDDSITAEITPRIRPEGWTLKKLQKLARDKTYVKLTGLLMLDTQHLNSDKPARVTDWEIHPVTKLQVCTGTITGCKAGDGWVDLADFPEP